jgi:hypothetical protein
VLGSESTLGLPLFPESQQATKLDNRLGVVVDAKVADTINPFATSLRGSNLLDDERSRLLPAAIASCSLTRFERRQQPLSQWPVGREVGKPHRRKNVRIREHVSLYRELRLNKVARPLHTPCPGVCSRASVSGNCPELTELRINVESKHPFKRLRRISPSSERR